jgi:hypothetical protein
MSGVHLHLLLSHVPIMGVLIGAGLLAAAILFRSRQVTIASLVLFALMALAGAATFATGEPAEDAIEHFPDVTKQRIERHEDAAKVAAGATYLLGGASLIGLLVIYRFPRLARWTTPLVLVLSLGVAGLLAWAANRGGEIRHTEIGSSLRIAGGSEGHD